MLSVKDACFLDGVMFCDERNCRQCRRDEERWLEKWLSEKEGLDNRIVATRTPHNGDVAAN